MGKLSEKLKEIEKGYRARESKFQRVLNKCQEKKPSILELPKKSIEDSFVLFKYIRNKTLREHNAINFNYGLILEDQPIMLLFTLSKEDPSEFKYMMRVLKEKNVEAIVFSDHTTSNIGEGPPVSVARIGVIDKDKKNTCLEMSYITETNNNKLILTEIIPTKSTVVVDPYLDMLFKTISKSSGMGIFHG